MITGIVNADHEVTVRIQVRGPGGQDHEVETILDTGFGGSLTLPQALIGNLNLTWRSHGTATLANGAQEDFDVYAATVQWDGQLRPILVSAIGTIPLLGMALLVGFDLRARVRVGGSVEIEAIP